MSEEPVFVPVPVCEVCWLIEHTNWEPEAMTSDGKLIMKLTGVDVPTRADTESVDVCSDCGSITIAGIYDLRDKSTLADYGDSEFEYDIEDDPTRFTLNMGMELESEDGDDYE